MCSVLHVLVTIVAVVQAMVSCYICLMVCTIIFYFGKEVDSIVKYVSFVDYIVGSDFAEDISNVAGFFKVVVLIIAIGQFVIFVLLCKGLCENKPWIILPYIVCGTILLGYRVKSVLSGELGKAEREDGVRFCYYYGGYLLFLFLFCVERVHNKRKQQDSVLLVPTV